ncbi:MAG: recombinase family protein [Ktedonobacterales bacterium]
MSMTATTTVTSASTLAENASVTSTATVGTAPTGRPRYSAPQLPKTAALYARVSKVQQGEEGRASLPTQISAMRAYAEAHGYSVLDEYIYIEKHSGEELYEREALTRLRADAKQRRFGLVLCYSVERFARNSAYIQIVLDEWERLGIRLQFATEELENTALGRAILNMRSFAGEVENERRKDRVHRALMARVQSGKPVVGSRPTYGYQWQDIRRPDGRLSRERLIEDPITSNVVKRIFTLADSGVTQRQIAGTLTAANIPMPSGKIGVWDCTTIAHILRNSIYWGQPVALKRRAIPVEKSVRHLYRRRTRDIPRPPEEQIALPTAVAPPLVSQDLAERVQLRQRQNQEHAARNNRQPAATITRGMVYCGICGRKMTQANGGNKTLAGPQFRCDTGTRLLGVRRERCRPSGNTIMAHRLDEAAWHQMIELFASGGLSAELAAARRAASEQRVEADQPARDLAARITDAEKRLANLRRMAELVEDEDEAQALATRITLLARDRDAWKRELAGREAIAARPRLREEAIRAFEAHVAAAHGDMEQWAGNLMRQLLLILDAKIEVWPMGDIESGIGTERAVLHLSLPLGGARHAALSQLLRDEHVLTAVGADPTDTGDPTDPTRADCADHALARSTMKT